MMRRTRRSCYLWLLFPGCVLLSSVLFAQAQEIPRSKQEITVRVVDGVTGLPEWFEFPNIWIGSSTSPSNPRLNFLGEVQNGYRGDVDKGRKFRYSLDEILETGVVVENVCGWVHAKRQPGVIVFYVRHRTLAEIIAL